MNERIRILLVEDNEYDFLLIKESINRMKEDFDLIRSTSLEEIKNYLTQDISLIICDFNLKAFTAETILDLQIQYNSKIPLIILSGTIGDEYAAHITKKGAVDYILKDNLVRLPKAITREIANYQSRKQNKFLETKIVQIQEQLIDLQKMEGYGKMAGGLAHDFNNLLAVMKINLMFLKKSARPDQSEVIEKLIDSEHKASIITEKLLAISKMNFGHAKFHNLNDVCSEMRGIFRSQISPQVDLVEQFESDSVGVFMDRGNLEQILLNLVLNANDSIVDKGVIRIATKSFFINEDYQLMTNTLKPGEYSILEVKDNGKGIPTDQVKFIFDPFFTTKEFGKSKGLGLSVVYGLAHQAGGAISVQSEVGKGTTISVFFPKAENTKPAEQTIKESSVKITKDNLLQKIKTVLLVDDSRDLNAIFESLLQSYGLNVMTALNVADAQKILEQKQDRIDLILSDMVMPNGTGMDLLKWSRDKGFKHGFIIMSGYLSDIIDYKDINGLGAVFLEKPFSEESFFDKLSMVIKNEPANC